MQAHLSDMDRDLRAAGFAGELLVVTSFGGVLRLEDTTQRPLYTVNSGPAMAPVAGKEVAAPIDNIVVCDTGGTSFDVSVVRGGEVQFTRETWLDGLFTGHITGLSSVDVKNVGAGGGSIAWIDSGGLLRVGPQSAGAEPGPACYGHGGTDPTVTDAAVVLGYIDPGYFLGGKLALDAAAAHRAIEEVVARPLGFSVQRAAWAILAVANEHMVGAVREITINQGIDPRESIVIAGGGAGGMTMSKIAEELGCDKVLVPQTAAALSATGGLLGDIVAEFTVSRRADTHEFDYELVNAGSRIWIARSTSSSRTWTCPPTRACRTTSSRRATRTRSGSSTWPCPAGASRARPTSTSSSRRSTRRTSASSRSRSSARASSACTGRDAPACTWTSRRWPRRRATGPARRAQSLARCGGATTRRNRRRCTSARPSGRARSSPARGRRAADDDGGVSRLGGDRHGAGRLPAGTRAGTRQFESSEATQ
jgi:hypothetical protein